MSDSISCLDEGQVLDYSHGRGSADARKRIQVHLATCAGCRALIATTVRRHPSLADTDDQSVTEPDDGRRGTDTRTARGPLKARAAPGLGTVQLLAIVGGVVLGACAAVVGFLLLR